MIFIHSKHGIVSFMQALTLGCDLVLTKFLAGISPSLFCHFLTTALDHFLFYHETIYGLSLV